MQPVDNVAQVPTTMTPAPTLPTETVSGSQTQQAFADSPEAAYSYQIFPGTVSDQAKQAMSGFSMETLKQADGSTQVTLVATNPEYKTQVYVVKQGGKLYFIERNPKDDSPENNTDQFPADDTAVTVDANGNIY